GARTIRFPDLDSLVLLDASQPDLNRYCPKKAESMPELAF
uniref:NTP_transf_9 domain-containing protein n=1 Tax=Steinernema glaseri TaxID=37863 RepID=A0A1I8AJC4_9BILA